MTKTLSVFIILFFLSNLSLKAQNWGGGLDDEDHNWGFVFQYISPQVKIKKVPNWRAPFFDAEDGINRYVTDSLNSISSPAGKGFGIGLVFNRRLSSHLDLRFTPIITFTDRLFDYQYQEPPINNAEFSYKRQKVSPTVLEIPLGVKLKSDRRKNFRAYVLGGAKFNYDLGSRRAKKEAEGAVNKQLQNRRAYFSYEGGIGFDLYFEYFKMSPEFKLAHSFGNILRRDATNPYAAPIDKAILRHFTFSLIFE